MQNDNSLNIQLLSVIDNDFAKQNSTIVLAVKQVYCEGILTGGTLSLGRDSYLLREKSNICSCFPPIN